MNKKIAIHWFRRDLRLEDNSALFHTLKNHASVLPLFIFDTDILDRLEDKYDARVTFIYDSILQLQAQLAKQGSTIIVRCGRPLDIWKELIVEFQVEAVHTNHDYEPYAIQRDELIRDLLTANGIPFYTYKDQVIFEKNEVLKNDGMPYTVFTPYSRKWKEGLTKKSFIQFDANKYAGHFCKLNIHENLSLKEIGFGRSALKFSPPQIDRALISDYDKTRDSPSVSGTSRLSVHLRFGTIRIRKLMSIAQTLNEKYFNELIWREFYQMILWHFPFVATRSFKQEYDRIEWRNNEKEFQAWCEGRTGYPLVDAGMRELNATGFMHNRVRMVTASFLSKHLLIDWRWGEAYFAKKLLDFELASNNGGWQWAAGTGADAAPYFRIFNPTAQAVKFDPANEYIRKWVPEFDGPDYPEPIVDHKFARERALKIYRAAFAKY